MDWLVALFMQGSIAHAILVLSLTVSLGLALGNVRVLGISLGVGGVLFAGLAMGHFGMSIHHELIEFVREFGLILFVYAIGLQVGPGFFSSLRRQGLTLNLFAVAIILGGTLLTVAISLLFGIDFEVAVGLLSGAVTNTPSLGAAQQALKDLPGMAPEAGQMVGLGYAVAYPFGILGIIITMLVVRRLFRINVKAETEEFVRCQSSSAKPIETGDFEVTNENLDGLSIDQLSELTGPGVVVTRIYRDGKQQLATPQSRLRKGDVIHGVGTASRLATFRVIVGRESSLDLPHLPSPIHYRRLIVTREQFVGMTLEQLDLEERYGLLLTRVVRSGVEFTPTRSMKLMFGDRLMVVGLEQAIERAGRELGDSPQELDRPHIIPIFLGIAMGVIVGSIPFVFSGMPAPVKLGLAGGPLIVAILMGRIGRIGPFVSYMPNAAKKLLSEFGIALFLACVGLMAGERFFRILFEGDGLWWMALAATITLLPILIVGIVARAWKKLNYLTLCGLLAGSMTDPPALAFATQSLKNDAPSISYATVYPLTMLMRVIVAQILVLIMLG